VAPHHLLVILLAPIRSYEPRPVTERALLDDSHESVDPSPSQAGQTSMSAASWPGLPHHGVPCQM